MLSLSLYSQGNGEFISSVSMEVKTPSEQTYQELENISGLPNLRAKPPVEEGDGGAQKMPLKESGLLSISILSIICLYLKKLKEDKIRKNI